MISTAILYGLVVGSLLGYLILAFHLGNALSKINFLKKEMGDADKWNANKHELAHNNFETIFARLNDQETKIEKQKEKLTFKFENAMKTHINGAQSAMSKFESRLTKKFNERADDIQNNMEVMATELKSMKKPVKKVTFKAFNTTTKKPDTVTFKVAKKNVVKK